jgi:hypothetical protein
MMNDLKFAFRQLLKNPGSTAVAVLTLALGIGANTVIFSAMGIPLLRGRHFADQDLQSHGVNVKIVRESFVRKYFPGEEVLGKRLRGVGGPGEIVGVVKDTLESSLDARPEPHIYHASVPSRNRALAATRLLAHQLFGVTKTDPATLAAVSAWPRRWRHGFQIPTRREYAVLDVKYRVANLIGQTCETWYQQSCRCQPR